jgi:hypothetical protein
LKLHHIGIACTSVNNIFFLKKKKLISVIDKFQNNKIFFDFNKDNNLWYEYIVPLNDKSTVFNALKNKEMLIHHLGFYAKDINKIKKKYFNKPDYVFINSFKIKIPLWGGELNTIFFSNKGMIVEFLSNE